MEEQSTPLSKLIEVDLDKGILRNVTTGKDYDCSAFPKEIQHLISQGGLINYTKNKLGV